MLPEQVTTAGAEAENRALVSVCSSIGDDQASTLYNRYYLNTGLVKLPQHLACCRRERIDTAYKTATLRLGSGGSVDHAVRYWIQDDRRS